MADESKKDVCPFCGSDKIRIETPYVDGFGRKISTFCCLSQKKNNDYINKHMDLRTGHKPGTEEVARW